MLLILVGLFNRIVDPFWYYRDIEINGFNAIKTKFHRFERHVKPALLIRDQPQAIILGSSFSEVGFDPVNPYFTDRGRLSSMNFALAGAQWDRVQCSFEFAVTHANIKRALIGFHPGNLPAAHCEKSFASFEKINTGELLLSNRALLASMQTILEQKKGKPSHTREGMYFYAREAAGVDSRFKERYQPLMKHLPPCMNTSATENISPDFAAGGELDLSGLRRIIEIARQHGVELVFFAYPRHAYSLELDQRCGEQNARWQAMKKIVTLAEAVSAKTPVRVWNFYAYNDITAEPIGDHAKYWQDPEHFNFEMGNMMLADMFDETRSKQALGKLLVSNRIDSDYRDFFQARREYLQTHPEFMGNLQKLLP